MGLDPITLGIIGTALGAGTSAAGAASQNQAIARSGRSLNRAELQRRQQNVNAAAVEREKRLRESRRIEGRIRAAAGATGRGVDGNFAALVRTNTFETRTDLNIIERNLGNALLNDLTSFEAQRADLRARQQNPLLESFVGGLAGLSAGLRIGGLLQGIAGGAGAAATGTSNAAGAATGAGQSVAAGASSPFGPSGPLVAPLP